jgi:hypothetical protein
MITKTFKEQLAKIKSSLISNSIKAELTHIEEAISNEDKIQIFEQDRGDWVICEQCNKEIKKKNIKKHTKSMHTEKKPKIRKNKYQVTRFYKKENENNSTEELIIKAESDNSRNQGHRPLSKYLEQRISYIVEQAELSPRKRTSTKREQPFIYNEETHCNDNICDGRFGQVVLKVKKGKFVGESHYCADCLKFDKPIWRYQNSNYGVIYLCSLCKTLAFERSFGYADAMPLKVDHAHAHKGKW